MELKTQGSLRSGNYPLLLSILYLTRERSELSPPYKGGEREGVYF